MLEIYFAHFQETVQSIQVVYLEKQIPRNATLVDPHSLFITHILNGTCFIYKIYARDLNPKG